MDELEKILSSPPASQNAPITLSQNSPFSPSQRRLVEMSELLSPQNSPSKLSNQLQLKVQLDKLSRTQNPFGENGEQDEEEKKSREQMERLRKDLDGVEGQLEKSVREDSIRTCWELGVQRCSCKPF